MALSIKLFVKGENKVLEVKQSVYGFTKTDGHFFYTGIVGNVYLDFTNLRASQVKMDDLFNYFNRLGSKKPVRKSQEAIDWLKKYHIPKAEVITL